MWVEHIIQVTFNDLTHTLKVFFSLPMCNSIQMFIKKILILILPIRDSYLY